VVQLLDTMAAIALNHHASDIRQTLAMIAVRVRGARF
jgi:hypothetical protein